MFTGKTIFQILMTGGVTMFVLLACSVLSIGVIIERLLYYRSKSRIKRPDFVKAVKNEFAAGNFKAAMELARITDTPYAKVAFMGMNLYGHDEKTVSEAMEREITIETVKLEKFTSIVGTIGSTSVYIGLFGTVLGIIRAFHDISLSGAGGINVVIGGISEALVNTAAGLLVAIPAVICYNYFIRKIDIFVSDMDLVASELLDLMSLKR